MCMRVAVAEIESRLQHLSTTSHQRSQHWGELALSGYGPARSFNTSASPTKSGCTGETQRFPSPGNARISTSSKSPGPSAHSRFNTLSSCSTASPIFFEEKPRSIVAQAAKCLRMVLWLSLSVNRSMRACSFSAIVNARSMRERVIAADTPNSVEARADMIRCRGFTKWGCASSVSSSCLSGSLGS